MNGLVVVGDALLDLDVAGRAERLAPDAPVPVVSGARTTARPGGAALAAYLAASDGRDVTLVTALGSDEASDRVRALVRGRLHLVELPLSGSLSKKTRIMAEGRALLRLDEGDGRAAASSPQAEEALAAAGTVLVSDYGRGTADVLRTALTAAAARVPLVWDPHPRGGAPVAGTRLATPSAAEARTFADGDGPTANARDLVRRWGVTSVAVTLGERGALLSHGGTPLLVPPPKRAAGDACGAGDRFAASAAGQLADGALPEDAVRVAVAAATRYVAAGGAEALGAWPERPAAARDLVEGVRAEGGTVVATGGCFDLLHAGHVALLEAARRSGDCLVVCLNSDESVRRLEGPGRPLVPVADRARVLRALGCVDAVEVFDEDTPERLLSRLRPHIWAKGGDYGAADLPEAELVRSWGGEVVLLPYLDGRSTTTLATRAARR
ncbi:PfkB family carbohydrate kinase [Streptomyces sp. GD-15H]|uniref:PfkB family carbohydrate kinase n=1 Tax=Streptomyces sp. GD-15H TaxID=3129112 RepID=UPI00325439EF